MKKKLLTIVAAVFVMSFLSGCCLIHDWKDATCMAPQTCTKCGKTKGDPLPHTWQEATCTIAKKCTVCLTKEGEPLGHAWVEATCVQDQYCDRCYEIGEKALGHDMTEASCKAPSTCTRCGLTDGHALIHNWQDTDPMSCADCGYTLPENGFENSKLSWYGVSVDVPEKLKPTEVDTAMTFAANSTDGAFSISVDRSRDYSLEQWAESYRTAVKVAYRIYSEEEVEVNGNKFYVFNVGWKKVYTGKCVLYAGDRMRVYMEILFKNDMENADDIINETLASFKEL